MPNQPSLVNRNLNLNSGDAVELHITADILRMAEGVAVSPGLSLEVNRADAGLDTLDRNDGLLDTVNRDFGGLDTVDRPATPVKHDGRTYRTRQEMIDAGWKPSTAKKRMEMEQYYRWADKYIGQATGNDDVSPKLLRKQASERQADSIANRKRRRRAAEGK